MDQYKEITEDLYKSIGIFKTIYEAGNISISNFFEKININKIEAEKKQSIQNGNANDLSPVIYDLCDFHSEFQSKNKINLVNFSKLEKGISDLKDIYDGLQLTFKDQTQLLLDTTDENKRLKQEKATYIERIRQEIEHDKAQEIQQLKEENSQYLNAFNNLKVESKSDKKTKERFQELMDEIKTLKNKLNFEEKKSREISSMHSDLVKKYDRLVYKYSEASQQVKYFEKTVVEFENKILFLKRSVEAKDKNISAKESMIDIRNKKIDKLNKENEDLKLQIKSSNKNASVSQYPQSKKIQLKEPDTSKSRKSVDLSASNNPHKQSFGETQQNTLLNQQNQELQQKIHEKDDTIRQLNMQIQSLKRHNPTSTPNYQKHTDSFINIDQTPDSKQIPPPDQGVQFYEQQISEKDQEIRHLMEENVALRKEVVKNNMQISSLTEQDKFNKETIQLLSSANNKSSVENQLHKQQISEKEILQLKQQVELLQKQNCQKENLNKSLSQENNQFRAAISDKNTQVQNIIKQYNDLKFQSDKEHEELSVLRIQVKTACVDKNKEIEQLKIEKQSNEKQILKLNQENEKLKNKVDKNKSKYVLENESLNFIGQEQEKLITKLEEESQNNRNEIEKLSKEKRELMQKSSELENQNKDLDNKVSKLESTNEIWSKKITDISDENKKLKADIENIKRNEEKLKKQLESEINKLKKGNNTTQVPQEKSIEILDTADIQNLEIINEIGFGSGGIIYKVAKKVIYALKKMRPQITHDEFQRFIAEYELMRILEHPNIVKTYGIFMSDGQNPPSILLEYCPSNLEYLINSRQQVTNIDLVFMIYQIVEGMKYVHFRNIVHRDLKPSNILIGEDGTIKIGDFGISKLMSSGEQMTQGRGTFYFMAPEILNQAEYNEKVDVYAFGVILFFILSGGLMPNITIIQVGTGHRAQIPDTFTEFSSQLISSCWNFNPNDRPSFEQIYKDIENNDFKLIEMDETEIDEVKKMIKNHKMKIPNY